MKKVYFIFILALLLQLSYVLFVPQFGISHDSAGYTTVARNIVTEHAFSDAFSKSSLYWPPGYPFFISAIYKIFGIKNTGVRIIQAILNVLVVFFIYHIACKIFNFKIGLLSGIISCIYPGFLGYSGILVPQALVTFLISLFIFLIIEFHSNISLTIALFLGLIAGYSSLVRTELILLWTIFFALIIFINRVDKRIIKFLILGFSMMCFVISLWTIRNYKVSGKFVLVSTSPAHALWLSTWKEEWLEWHDKEPLISITKNLNPSGTEIAERCFKAGINNLKEHPFIYLKMCFKRLYRFWLTGHSNTFYFMKDSFLNYFQRKNFLIFFIKLIMLIFNITIILFGFIGIRIAFSNITKKRIFLLYILLPILYFMILHFFIFATPRYSIPVMPYVIIFSSYGILSSPFFKKESNQKKR